MNGKANNDVPPDLLDDLGENDEEAVTGGIGQRRRSRSRGLAGIGEGRSRGHPPLLGDPARLARRLSHDRCQGRRALCRQGPKPEGEGRLLHARPRPLEPHRPHDRRDGGDGIRHHGDRDRGPAARGQPHQAAEAPLQRAAQGRQVAALHPADGRPRGAADRQASRRAQPKRRLLRAVRQRLGGQPDRQRPAARLSPALLQRQLLREPHASVPALSDQALLGSLHGRDLARATTAGSPPRRAPSCPASRTSSSTGSRPRCRTRPAGLEFERAARYRDRIAALAAVQATQGINTQGLEEADVFALDEQAGQFCVEVFFFRNHQNWGNRAYFPKAHKSTRARRGAGLVPGAVLRRQAGAALHPPVAGDRGRRLSSRRRWRAGPATASRSACRSAASAASSSICAVRNAKEALGRRLAETSSQQKLLTSLGQAFALPRTPRRVEVFDNSHIMGTNAVGAMIVAGAAGFMKTHYRTFNIKSEELTPGDDYGMMREVLRRRFARLVKEAPRDADNPSPALRGRSRARSARSDEGGETHAVMRGTGRSPSLTRGASATPDPLRRTRGERGGERGLPGLAGPRPDRRRQGPARGGAGRRSPRSASPTCHSSASPRAATATPAARRSSCPARRPSSCRRAIPRSISCSACATRRIASPSARIGRSASASMIRSPLDEIAGIGPSRKRALLHHFGTVKAIERAALDDLMRTPGVNAATARAVYEYFHDGKG